MSTRRFSTWRWSICSPTPGSMSATIARCPMPAIISAPRIGKQPVLMVRHTDGDGLRALQPLPAQGHAHHHRNLRQRRQILPLPLSRLVFKTDGSLLAIPLRKGYEHTGLEQSHAAQGHRAGASCDELPRLRVCQTERCRAWLRGIISAKAFRASTTWSTARRSGSSRSPAASLRYMHQLQLEDAGREPDRHLPPDGGA